MALLYDLQGPKLRIGDVKNGEVVLEENNEIEIKNLLPKNDDITKKRHSNDKKCLNYNNKNMYYYLINIYI